MNDRYNVSFRCFYNNADGFHYNNHYQQDFPLSDIPRWIDSYKFTHPNCTAVTVKVWFVNGWDQGDSEE